ncbi:MAG TPA: glycosyltransferase family 9 protein [Rhizomicrobium sp.]|nr:glycosyltransferase family 9 protein [Rhizomicrobium sp.]
MARLLLRLERSDAEARVIAEYRAELLAALRAASRSTNAKIRAEASHLLSRVLLDLGESDGALAAAEAAVAGPEEGRASGAKANALLAAGHINPAKREYDRLLDGMPQDSPEARSASIASVLCKSADITTNGTRPFLLAVGGGIGDLLHTTPLIRNISRRTGSKVDVLIAGDHASAEFLFRNSRLVNQVWPISSEVLKQNYQRVFVTYSFGPLRLPFQAEQVLISRSWRPFRPGHLNETVFNLEAAKALLGISYERDDTTRYFAGELVWQSPPTPLVGLHAGSKNGRWVSKRWPHFAELAARLKVQGLAVASFGTEDQYVEGSENRTGGSIEEMSRAMLECSLFISNDSGPMHIASAMGIPVLALYAPTDPFTHLPIAPDVTALALQKSCAPCEVKNHSYFATGACRCMGDISVDVVEQKALSLLPDTLEHPRRLAEAQQ